MKVIDVRPATPQDALVLVAVSPTGSNPQVVGHLIGTFAEPSDMWRAAQAELVSMYVAPPAPASAADWSRDSPAGRAPAVPPGCG